MEQGVYVLVIVVVIFRLLFTAYSVVVVVIRTGLQTLHNLIGHCCVMHTCQPRDYKTIHGIIHSTLDSVAEVVSSKRGDGYRQYFIQ